MKGCMNGAILIDSEAHKNKPSEKNIEIYPHKYFFYDFLWLEDKIIFPEMQYNTICETEIWTGSTRIIDVVDTTREWTHFYGIYKWREYIILPGVEEYPGLYLFNLINNEWSCIEVEANRKKWVEFREETIFEYNNYLYIFSFQLVVLRVDIEKRSIDFIFYPNMEPDDDIRGEIICVDNTVYVPLKHGKKICKFDLTSEKWEIVEVNTDLKGIDTLCYDGRRFWMSGVGKLICSWNEEMNESDSYQTFPQGFCKLGDIDDCAKRKGEEGFWFQRSFLYGDLIYFLPADANMLVAFDTKKKRMEEVRIEDEEETKESLDRAGRFSTVKYMGAKQRDNLLLMMSNKNKNLILLDLRTGKTQIIELSICAESEFGKIISNRLRIDEGIVNLWVWIKYAIHKDAQKGEWTLEKLMGKKIYDAMK